jgi:hypothetical protein
MMKGTFRRLFVVSLSFVLTMGLLVGCGSGNTNSSSANASDQQVEQQAEKEEGHEHEEGHEEGHEEEGHEHGHNHGPDHFEGKKAETYDEAVSNMTEANGKLEDILAKDEITEYDLRQVHKMSYTMENALAVIKKESDEDLSDVSKSLEAVHLASEDRDVETVRKEGQNYLDGSDDIIEQK